MERKNTPARLATRRPGLRVVLGLLLLGVHGCARNSLEDDTTNVEEPAASTKDAGKDAAKGTPTDSPDDSDDSDDETGDGEQGDQVGAPPTAKNDAGAARFDAGGKRDAATPPPIDAARPDSASPPGAAPSATSCKVGPVPEDVRATLKLSPFYKKYVSADGITITSSDKPVDRTLELACLLINEMVSKRPDVRDAIIKNKSHFAIVAASEQTTDIPEYSDLPDYYNTRARGLGGILGLCAEESILCDKSKDRWYGESICVHEYAHTISIYGLYTADPTFEKRLKEAFSASKAAGLWTNTYAAENEQEYWAEGVQNWYNTNLSANPPNGVHGPIRTKDGLLKTDPALYKLVSELVPDEVKWPDCYRKP